MAAFGSAGMEARNQLKSCSRGCPANSPTLSINTPRTAASRRKRTFRVPKAAANEPAKPGFAKETGCGGQR